MSKSLRALLSLLGLLLLIALAVLLWMNRDGTGVPTETTSGQGTDSSSLTADDALAALQDLEFRMGSTPIRVIVGDREFQLIPNAIGFDIDERSTLERALETGDPAWVVEAAAMWNQGPSGPALPLVGGIDEVAFSNILDRLDSTLYGPSEGAIVVEGDTPVAQYPHAGWIIDRSETEALFTSALLAQPRPESIAVGLLEQHPTLPASAVEMALDEATVLLSSPITLSRTDPTITLHLTRDQLARAFITQVEREPHLRMVVTLDPAVVDEYLYPLRTGFESAPIDARIEVDQDDNLRIIPGFPGALINTDLVIEAVMDASRRPSRSTVLPLQAGVPPRINAEYLASLGLEGKMSEFTTEHRCCQPRVSNIQRFANAINSTIVLPGEILSLNETVGERTSEGGYVPAPTIIRGEIKDTVGGGVSQFATTFYNAVFWAGLEIIEHQPHSYYFPRYPEGIEATINWTQPDLIFRNDTDYAVLISTSYTATSITVKLFGNNSDRQVGATVSERYNWKDFPTEYLPNPEIMPWEGEQEVEKGAHGWSVKVNRFIEFTDGSTASQDWTVHYRPRPRQVEVHPCLLPEDSEDYTGEECPPDPASEIPTTAPNGGEEVPVDEEVSASADAGDGST